MKLGCHAVLFRERIKTETEAIIRGLAETGFQGVEIGSRFFGTGEKQELLGLLGRYHLELSGMHVGGELRDWIDKEEAISAKVLAVAEFVKDTANPNVVLSGSRIAGPADLRAIAQNIEKVAGQCLRMGVRLNYHNHDWEFAAEAALFKALAANAPSLYFGLDLGWVWAGGFDPMAIVSEVVPRVAYVHLRDPKGPGKEFVNLGEGVFDFSKLMSGLKTVLPEDGWAVVEYEEGEPDFGRYARAKAFLDRVMETGL
ncbi:sugar phosphate isomerase/epimerase [Hydrogenispora ethanolica]|uniref:Sugar phosphate isomerase/epimerase n=1 Tax=Hydrogenispora ethanolica TaxID=1082276 RepID=A0A4R1RMA0_HYDET|nr:sugar phosphate isomerase/epimerase [Hydrogenispora ethanolica]TCL67388.1 sugar phosphate isomerase/epimerase [Hydrogenispora ethanolica]